MSSRGRDDLSELVDLLVKWFIECSFHFVKFQWRVDNALLY